MNRVSDIKEVFSEWRWESRIEEDPKRIYGFILCADEHSDFISFIRKSWRTLDKLSGRYCDIFTLESFEWEEHDLKHNLYIPGGRSGEARRAQGDFYGISGQTVAVDNGLMIPDRTQCIDVRDRLFAEPQDVVLPGFAVFHSIGARDGIYYNCSGLSAPELSDGFQHVLGSIRTAYENQLSGVEVFDHFYQLESKRSFKKRLSQVALSLSFKDIYKIIGDGLGLVMPKS